MFPFSLIDRRVCRIDNLIIEADEPEMFIMDGTANLISLYRQPRDHESSIKLANQSEINMLEY